MRVRRGVGLWMGWIGLFGIFHSPLVWATGGVQWNSFLGASGFDSGSALAVDADGGVYVTGTSEATWGSPIRDFTPGNDVFVAKLTRVGPALEHLSRRCRGRVERRVGRGLERQRLRLWKERHHLGQSTCERSVAAPTPSWSASTRVEHWSGAPSSAGPASTSSTTSRWTPRVTCWWQATATTLGTHRCGPSPPEMTASRRSSTPAVR